MRLFKIFLLLVFFSSWLQAQRLPLPGSSIGLDTPEGQTLLLESTEKADYWPLSLHFETQDEPSHCGPASSIMVLNSLAVAAPLSQVHQPFRYFDQQNFFQPSVQKILPLSVLRTQGATLDQLGAMLACWGTDVEVHHAADFGVEMFRRQARQAVASGQEFVILNFHRDPFQQVGGSHFSPLAAYHENSDRFLVMDVARYRYPPFWVTTERLFESMNTLDGVSRKTRGYLLIKAAR